MSSDDVSVADLLEDFGQDLTLTRAGTPTYNPATGTVTNASGTTISVRGVFIYFRREEIDNTVVKMGDRRLLVTADGATGAPSIGDIVSGHKIINVRSFAPNGTVVAWDCQVRA